MATDSNRLQSLSPKHRRMAFYIARGIDKASVARRFGVEPASMSRFMADPLVKNEVERIQRLIEERSLSVLDDALVPLRDNLHLFAETIVAIVRSEDASNNAKLKAIDLGFSLVKPDRTKEDAGGKRMPGLNITIKRESDPEFKLVSGGAE